MQSENQGSCTEWSKKVKGVMTTGESEAVLYSDVDLGYLDSVREQIPVPNRRDMMSTNLWIKAATEYDCDTSVFIMWFDDQQKRATFESQKFAEGRFRNAYKGTWINPLERRGRNCVVKEKKDTYTWNPTDWDTSVKIQKKAQELAGSFNVSLKPSHPVSFTEVDVLQVIKTDSLSGPRLHEYVLVEDFIPGSFKKWCSNYGFISDEAKITAITMPAFMHWSWIHTGGEMMIADLQGVRGDDGYTLTDPVILSSTGAYGATDMGVEGMAMFFLHHECNGICSGLSKPTYWDVITRIPQLYRASCEQLLQQVMSSTTYTFELKFPPHIRATVLQTFREIARR